MVTFFSKRKVAAATTCVLLLTLLVGATFAWTNFQASRINEFRGTGTGSSTTTGYGGSLRDDHEENREQKDVFVENWGERPLMVRVRLSEYMEIGPNAGTLTLQNGMKFRGADNESTPLVDGSIGADGSITFTPHIPSTAADVCENGFHEFWDWTMGGRKWYMPATEAQMEEARRNGGSSVIQDLGEFDENTPGARQTLSGEVITMEDWLALPAGNNDNFWVIDNDGWAYWTNALRPNTSTSLLMSRVEMVEHPPDYYYYGIHVQLELVSFGHAFSRAESLIEPFGAEAIGIEPINIEAVDITPISDDPNDFRSWVRGIGTEKASTDAIQLLRRAFENAADDGLLGNVEISDEAIDVLFEQEDVGTDGITEDLYDRAEQTEQP